ncbi:MAG TPA: LacI family DNA-binding transcriptional regulator [Terracidiphilus sp.]|jgi:LacI family transcriptional regulator
MSISMRELARMAGMSSATVSRVINGSSLVTEETARRIQRIIKDTGFVPNNSAIHLKNGKSHIYGIIIPDLTNPFFTELIKVFEELLVENDQELLLASTDFHSTRTQRSVRRMLLRRVDGVAILTSELETASLESLIKNRIPVVTTDHYRIGPGWSDIVIDFRAGMAQMIAHLKELGHSTVGFIGGTPGLATSRVRRESFLDAVVKQGLSSREGWMVNGNFRIEGGFAAMEKILAEKEIPTAVVTANDLTAIGALRKAHEAGLRIPADISIAGCDDIEMSDIVFPPLTTLRISRREYAAMMMEALRCTGDLVSVSGRQFTLPMRLITRASTGPAPASRKVSASGAATRKSR